MKNTFYSCKINKFSIYLNKKHQHFIINKFLIKFLLAFNFMFLIIKSKKDNAKKTETKIIVHLTLFDVFNEFFLLFFFHLSSKGK